MKLVKANNKENQRNSLHFKYGKAIKITMTSQLNKGQIKRIKILILI